MPRKSSMDLDLIEPNLYLGPYWAAEDVETLKKFNITHILTIHDFPLDDEITENKNFTTKYVEIVDTPEEVLLVHFDDTYAFISEGLSKGIVLVHCYMGRSRSASVVIAFMMKKYQLTYEEAFEKVKQKRSEICPNPGFVSQLELYRVMGCQLDSNFFDYKICRLRGIAESFEFRCQSRVPQNSMDLFASDPALLSKTEPQLAQSGYYCSKCSRILASESSFIPHIDKGELCKKSFFFTPVAWMQGVTETMRNELFCPTCNTKVGSFDWNREIKNGIKCECNFKMFPAFCLESPQVKCVLK